jgi:hypothetical protein
MKKRIIRLIAIILGLLGLSSLVIACYGPPPIDENSLDVNNVPMEEEITEKDLIE